MSDWLDNQKIIRRDSDVFPDQERSTPGIYKIFNVIPDMTYEIVIKDFLSVNCSCNLWLGTSQTTTLSFNPIEGSEHIETFKNETDRVLFIGILFNKFTLQSSFRIPTLLVRETGNIHVLYNKYRLDRHISSSGSDRMSAIASLNNACLWDLSNPEHFENLFSTQIGDTPSGQILVIESSCAPSSTHNFPTYIDIDKYDKLIKTYDTKCYLLEDMHTYTHARLGSTDYSDLINWLTRNNIEILVALCDNYEWHTIVERATSTIPRLRPYLVPYHIDTAVFKDYRLNKTRDILLYGACTSDAYPFRLRLRTILEGSDLQYLIVRSPHYFDRNPNFTGAKLAQMINQSWLTIATKSNYSYLVAKYFEISACNSLVVGNMPDDGLKIWNDNFVHITEEMSDQEILDTIKKALQDKESIMRKCETMYKIIHTQYNMGQYATRISRVLHADSGRVPHGRATCIRMRVAAA